jgi:type I restriction enzyme S subunit
MEALGAVFSALVTKDFETKEIIEPDHRLISLYGEKVSPIYEYILNKARQNNKLNQLRDLLLSKLATVEN